MQYIKAMISGFFPGLAFGSGTALVRKYGGNRYGSVEEARSAARNVKSAQDLVEVIIKGSMGVRNRPSFDEDASGAVTESTGWAEINDALTTDEVFQELLREKSDKYGLDTLMEEAEAMAEEAASEEGEDLSEVGQPGEVEKPVVDPTRSEPPDEGGAGREG
ncbi:hypothetical protein RZS08_19245, partial [Arthrospira platensis SPKY1]|nr:hypothetical protein [Arthrospira platensis SPKY1]